MLAWEGRWAITSLWASPSQLPPAIDALRDGLESRRLLTVNSLEVAGGYRVADDNEPFGADFFDLFPGAGPDDETTVALGDVCGKGSDATLLATNVRDTLRDIRSVEHDHTAMLAMLNTAMLSDDNSRFATLVLASAIRRQGRIELTITCAGHPAPMIVRNTGHVERAHTRGTLIGALPEFRARSWTTTLSPGEVCVLYTNGVTEARGGPSGTEAFGDHRLESGLRGCGRMPADAVADRVMTLAARWVGRNTHDDMAVLTMAVTVSR